ncbi:MAG: hypothetical protein KIT84_14270 [Labilithrix sp.]|nr:hypothetical protein [Labilithrix sp.]MCW5812187.1 hypothetical protein [Labilithrix sp.]
MNKQLLFVLPVATLTTLACSSKETVYQVVPAPDAGTTPADDDDDTPKVECTAARESHLGPVAATSTGEVKVLSNEDGVTKIFVDATAGGINNAKKNPRVYIKLDGTKVDITDQESFTSSDWDLALKRVDIYTNGGDAGPGEGGGRLVNKDFGAVTAADGAGVRPEVFFTGDCERNIDEASFIVTTFSGWYNYAESNNIPSAKPGTSFVVKSADGTLHKVGIISNTANPDGTTNNPVTAYYLLQVSKL